MVTSNRTKDGPLEDSIKETIESIVIAFILAFVFRAYIVEAFVIPTGSMAPTLLGRHIRLVCHQCGYQFVTDTPHNPQAGSTLQGDGHKVSCPMCHYVTHLPDGTAISAGDRILVQKYIYTLNEPRRWDVIVFKSPKRPNINFIKRLVGLSNERLWIVEGNIYVQSLDDELDHPWKIARKPVGVQRAVWQPVYHSQFEPLDQGEYGMGRGKHPWTQPWVADDNKAWPQRDRHGFRYTKAAKGVIEFDFSNAFTGGIGLYGYNQLKQRKRGPRDEIYSPRKDSTLTPIEDVRVAASFLPDASGLSVSLRTTARLDSPSGEPLELIGRVDDQGTATLTVRDPNTNEVRELVPPKTVDPLTPDKATHVELWYVDQEASLWVDGQRIHVCQFDLPIHAIKERKDPVRWPKVAIEVKGGAVTMNQVAVDRDLYYTSMDPLGNRARGAMLKLKGYQSLEDYVEGPWVELNDDQFFCLGDNSPLSQDSRFWDGVDSWVRKRMFDSKTEKEDILGIVPRNLIMGKAFFVYFPTPLRIVGNSPPQLLMIPNFGDVRFIR